MAYLLPNGVLRNRLGITDGELLAVAEADITRAKLVVLAERPLLPLLPTLALPQDE